MIKLKILILYIFSSRDKCKTDIELETSKNAAQTNPNEKSFVNSLSLQTFQVAHNSISKHSATGIIFASLTVGTFKSVSIF